MTARKRKTLLEFLERIPPNICRIMAVKGRYRFQLKTLQEIQIESGLSYRMVERLAVKSDWEGVRIDVASKFISGCGVEFFNPKTAYELERKVFGKRFDRHLYFLTQTQIERLEEWLKTKK